MVLDKEDIDNLMHQVNPLFRDIFYLYINDIANVKELEVKSKQKETFEINELNIKKNQNEKTK